MPYKGYSAAAEKVRERRVMTRAFRWLGLTVALLLPCASRANDLGPLLSECVGAECPLLSAYPSPLMFGPVTTWTGHDEAFNAIVLGDFTVPAPGAAETEGLLA